MNKRVAGVLVLLFVPVALCLGSRAIRVYAALHETPPVPARVVKVTGVDDGTKEPSCDDVAYRTRYELEKSAMKYEDWCAATIAGPRLLWRNQHIDSVSDETICSWKSAYHVALKCERVLREDDAFLVASNTIDEVGAESLAWVVQQWREGDSIPKDVTAFRKLGLEPYAVILEKAKAVRKDAAKLEALGEEWAALEARHTFGDWFEKECPALVKCTPR